MNITAREAAWRLLSEVVPPDQLDTESMRETPDRIVKALKEMTEGYGQSPREILSKSFDAEGFDEIVVVGELPFTSLCEHHVLAFSGYVWIAYLPSTRIVGLSKFPRLVRALSRRLQVQERLTAQIANEIESAVKPRGVAVVVRAGHSCMSCRGIESSGSTTTSVVRGLFKEDEMARAEVHRLMPELR